MNSYREERMRVYDHFLGEAKERFQRIAAQDSRFSERKALRGFNVGHGNSNIVGYSERECQVWYGKHVYESLNTIEFLNGTKTKHLVETGGALKYDRGDKGFVVVTIHGPKTDYGSYHEDGILFDFGRNPRQLLKDQVLSRDVSFYHAYLDVGSVYGTPTFKQRITVWYLRNFWPYIANGRTHEARATVWLKSVLGSVLTIGLSGFLLFGLQWWFGVFEK